VRTCVSAESSAATIALRMKAAIITGSVSVKSSKVAVTICAWGNGNGMRESFLHVTHTHALHAIGSVHAGSLKSCVQERAGSACTMHASYMHKACTMLVLCGGWGTHALLVAQHTVREEPVHACAEWGRTCTAHSPAYHPRGAGTYA
jgi:hypothetical protein